VKKVPIDVSEKIRAQIAKKLSTTFTLPKKKEASFLQVIQKQKSQAFCG
jgi:hypothetical protein